MKKVLLILLAGFLPLMLTAQENPEEILNAPNPAAIIPEPENVIDPPVTDQPVQLNHEGVSDFVSLLEKEEPLNYQLVLPAFQDLEGKEKSRKTKASHSRIALSVGLIGGGALAAAWYLSGRTKQAEVLGVGGATLAGVGVAFSWSLWLESAKLRPSPDDYARVPQIYNENNPERPVEIDNSPQEADK